MTIYYDPLPVNLTVEELSYPPYDSSYAQGELIGSVLPEGWEFEEILTIKADNWEIAGNAFKLSFDMETMFNLHGKGVYTFLVWGQETHYTTYSIWKK